MFAITALIYHFLIPTCSYRDVIIAYFLRPFKFVNARRQLGKYRDDKGKIFFGVDANLCSIFLFYSVLYGIYDLFTNVQISFIVFSLLFLHRIACFLLCWGKDFDELRTQRILPVLLLLMLHYYCSFPIFGFFSPDSLQVHSPLPLRDEGGVENGKRIGNSLAVRRRDLGDEGVRRIGWWTGVDQNETRWKDDSQKRWEAFFPFKFHPCECPLAGLGCLYAVPADECISILVTAAPEA